MGGGVTDFHEFRPTQRTITERMRDRLLRVLNVVHLPSSGSWSWRFFELMMNRLELGRYRYGPFDEGCRDSISSAVRRLQAYLPDEWTSLSDAPPPSAALVWYRTQQGVNAQPMRGSAVVAFAFEATHWCLAKPPEPRLGPSGNLEHLVDAASLCLVEWVKSSIGLGQHPSPSWAPTDNGGEHSKPI